MKPAPFRYAAPTEIEDALILMADHGANAKLLAGGQSLVPLMNFRQARPSVVVDLNRITALRGIRRDGDGLHIGAMARYVEIERSSDVADGWPILAHAVTHIAHQQVRSRGTVGGSLAQNHPGAEMPLVLLALDAVLVVRGPRETRTLAMDELYRADGATAIAADEILVKVVVPEIPTSGGWGFREVTRRHGDASIVAAAAVLAGSGTGVSFARIALAGVANRPIRFNAAEAQLREHGQRPLQAALTDLKTEFAPPDSPFAPGWYRRDIACALVSRVVDDAFRRISESGDAK